MAIYHDNLIRKGIIDRATWMFSEVFNKSLSLPHYSINFPLSRCFSLIFWPWFSQSDQIMSANSSAELIKNYNSLLKNHCYNDLCFNLAKVCSPVIFRLGQFAKVYSSQNVCHLKLWKRWAHRNQPIKSFVCMFECCLSNIRMLFFDQSN